jgi:hypothetical protein
VLKPFTEALIIKIINKKKIKANIHDKDNEIILDTRSDCCLFFSKLTDFAIISLVYEA